MSVRHRVGVALAVLVLILGCAVGTVYWFEADKEVRILCGVLPEGTPRAEVIRVLGTANLLTVEPGAGLESADEISFRARANLGTSRCQLTLADDSVRTAAFARDFRLERVAALLALAPLGFLVGFQILLARGAISGRLAWGGQHEVLPRKLRVASAFSACLVVLFAWILLERAGVTRVIPGSGIVEVAGWLVYGFWLASTLGNLASDSPAERRIGIPVASLLAILAGVVAYSG